MKYLNYRNLSIALGGLALAVITLPLLRLGYIGHWVRYMADDYCTAAVLHSYGFWQTQAHWYQAWTGRYSFTFFVSVAEWLGINSTKFVPLIFILLVEATGLWIARNLRPKTGSAVTWYLWTMALVNSLVLTTLMLTPNPIQSFFWETGGLTYFVPFIFLALTVGCVAQLQRGRYHRSFIALAGLSSLIAAGFSESFSTLQIALWAYVLLLGLIFYREPLKAYLGAIMAALAGAVIGLAIVVAAPGNRVRLSYFPPHQGIGIITRSSIDASLHFSSQLFSPGYLYIWLTILVLAMTVCLLKLRNRKPIAPRPLIYQIVFSPILLVGLLTSIFLPIYYGYTNQTVLPDRTLILGVFVATFIVTYLGFLIGALINRRVSTPHRLSFAVMVLAVLLAIAISTHGNRLATDLRNALQVYAQNWTTVSTELTTQPSSQATITYLPGVGATAELQPDKTNWYNSCIANYYHLKSVTVKHP